ncbi:MAG: sigma 54-interacting transcriptional regulator [Bryobacteraceae bacterium]|nr:sigma 54-interacting transcriptional regulator [Bryobacteraceae bacterium]
MQAQVRESFVREPQLFVGESLRSKQLMRLINKLGNSRWPVLVLGETGTGKEVVSRTIHNLSPVGPFVTIDCSAMVGTIIESELFGHAKGAFTGAVGTKMGLIEAANGGTAFFDEIGELPLDLQAKLLRVLQEKEFRPVGSLQPRHSDFRVIAATNRDLAKEVERGTFRRDLYYRLNVVSVKLPPLRDRKDEIPALVDHFLVKYGRNHRLANETLEGMLAYDWPGNVRELENCIQRMVAMHTGPLLTVADLPSNVLNHTHNKRREAVAIAVGGMMPQMMPPPDTAQLSLLSRDEPPVVPLQEMERREIMRALEYTRGDRGLAATLLGIGRTTLYRKLKEYHLAS